MVQKVIFTSNEHVLSISEDNHPSRVMVESPLGGDLQRNLIYARLCMRHSLMLCGESPMAFHLIYPQSLCDDTDVERSMGITRSFAWHSGAEAKLFYIDRGFSNGMRLGYQDALKKGIHVEFRTLSQEDMINRLVVKLNSAPQSDAELEKVSVLLKSFTRSDHGLESEVGDASSFRRYYQDELLRLTEIAEDINHESLEFERLAMRHSLVEKGEAPLSLNLLYKQFICDDDCCNLGKPGDAWLLVADKVVSYIPFDEANKSMNDAEVRSVDFQSQTGEIDIIRSLNDPNYSSRERELADELGPV